MEDRLDAASSPPGQGKLATPDFADILLSSKAVTAAATFLVLALVPYLSPRLAAFRLIGSTEQNVPTTGPTGIVPEYGELSLQEGHNAPPPALEEHVDPPLSVIAAGPTPGKKPQLSELARSVGAVYRPIEDPTGHAMDAFFASLARTESGAPGAVTRVAHYGDSLLVSDFMSSTLRRRFQQQFGDAGHGFILMAKPWAWYFHQDVSYWSSEGWSVQRIVNPRIGDELYGYGGATFRTSDSARAGFGTVKVANPAPAAGASSGGGGAAATSASGAGGNAGGTSAPPMTLGRYVSKFEVHYLEQPDGGSFDLSLDGVKVRTVATRAPTKRFAVATVDAADGEHQLEVHTLGNGEARFFGVALERSVPGVVWDALGINGARARILDVNDDAHWAEALRRRDPALVVMQYGTNESEDTGYPFDQYESTLEAVLRQIRAALPQSSCLVVGAMDRAGAGTGGLETRPIIPRLVDAQRKIAARVGCGFWDTYGSMGGSGSMGRWAKSTPKLGGGDLTHPTALGAALLGDLLYTALLEGYREGHPVVPRPAVEQPQVHVAPVPSSSTPSPEP